MHNTLGVHETFAERLRWARETAGLTTRQLATAAGVSPSYPSAIECKQFASPTVAALEKLATALGVTFEWLHSGRGRRPAVATLKKRGQQLKGGRAA